ncbi:deoxynucleoside triphosphate triphosphohydrolase [Acrasis kona]|uniref:Deoxynucleoside triphosphate triphosphohydrolase n=1 Tax=Acrasis kona TaxID=1008807 RepID=A0AAW2Z4N7_9EUKA
MSMEPAIKQDRVKVVNDPIYGMMHLNKKLFRIIDSPIYQRLRDIKQLGGMYMVFPGAAHNRFEHSIGTAHITGLWLKKLRKGKKDLYSKQDILHAQVAALCHDLGHGPFSHMFEDVFVNQQGKCWKHEEAGCHLLRLIVNECDKENDPDFRQDICDMFGKPTERLDILDKITCMIQGKVWEKDPNRPFLYQIVANKLNGIDADKLDYLARDTHSAALELGFSIDRLIEFSSLKEVEGKGLVVCFHRKVSHNVWNLFKSRHSLHKEVYSHTVVEGIELMIADVFKSARSATRFDLSHMLEFTETSLHQYGLLTDCILKEIERADPEVEKYNSDADKGCLDLKRAQFIINKLRRRKLYTCVAEIKVVVNEDLLTTKKKIKDNLNKEQAPKLRKQLREELCRSFNPAQRALKRRRISENANPDSPVTPRTTSIQTLVTSPCVISEGGQVSVDDMFRITTRLFDMAEFDSKNVAFYEHSDDAKGVCMPQLFASKVIPEAYIRVYACDRSLLEEIKEAALKTVKGDLSLNLYVSPKAIRASSVYPEEDHDHLDGVADLN